MTARIKRFYTRAELGMRAPRSVSYNITPQDGGVAVHYGGGGPNPAPSTFSTAKSIWLGWQRHHMDGNGWVDIAYTAGFDNEGNVYAGRGLGVRTAANGSNQGNDDFYAFVWIGGGNAEPSPEAYDALDWLIQYAREKGKAGRAVKPHKKFTGTACPGSFLTARAASLDGVAITLPTAPPTTQPKPPNPAVKVVVNGILDAATIRLWQTRMKAKGYTVTVDGKISTDGSQLVRAVQSYFNRKGIADRRGRALIVDGKGIRPNTKDDVGPTHTIEALQRYLRTSIDGVLSHPSSRAVRVLQARLNANTF